ncbi:MAG: holo-ACP synthase [Victivallales bacterium]|nr:holo-ACP synthase [Victivallales bacterium]
MIVGVGTDIVEIARLKASIERYGAHFLDHIYTVAEQAVAESKGEQRFAYYAGRWAAKEAVSKVFGTGFTAECKWTEICIANNDAGKPLVTLSGITAQTAEALGIRQIHLSISHEKAYACAFAVGES